MWVAIVLVFFLGSDGNVREQQFVSRNAYETSTACLQAAGNTVIQALPEDENIRGYAVTCRQMPTV